MKNIIEKSFDVKSLALWSVIGVCAIIVVLTAGVVAVKAYNGQLFGDCNNCTINVQGAIEAVGDAIMGASGSRFPNGISADTTSPVEGEVRGTTLTITGAATYEKSLSTISTRVASTTLSIADTGKTFILTSTTEFVLPATSTSAGVHYKFVIGADTTVSSTIRTLDSSNGIEGTLIVAGAVVDCAAEDLITFGAGVENIGDYVELWSNGTYWFIGDSGALTATAIACTAS
jgi:hypothetical protein